MKQIAKIDKNFNDAEISRDYSNDGSYTGSFKPFISYAYREKRKLFTVWDFCLKDCIGRIDKSLTHVSWDMNVLSVKSGSKYSKNHGVEIQNFKYSERTKKNAQNSIV